MYSRHLSLAVVTLAIAARMSGAQGLQHESPALGLFHPLHEGSYMSSPLTAEHPRILNPAISILRDTMVIDFEKRQITCVRADSLGYILWTHHYGELSDYLLDRSEAAMTRVWYQNFASSASGGGGQEKAQNLKLEWSLPVQYPGWAQRVLGNEPPRLSVNGSIRIKMAYEDIRRKESNVLQDTKDAGPGFVFDEQNQFTITGSIGRLININISANSEGDVDMNDPLKNFKIEYKESKPGELEDEVVQQVTAGYTGFSMPGTQLSGYSESKEGLFGIKVASKFGPVTLTTIISNEQGESQKLSVSNSSGAGKGSDQMAGRNENNYKENKYFFLDTAYIRHYNKKFGLKGGNASYQAPAGLEVKDLQVWVMILKEDATKYKADQREIREFFYDTTISKQKARFVEMQPERHYHLDPKEGWIRFTEPVDPSIDEQRTLVAIYLRTQDPAAYPAQQKGGDKDASGFPRHLWTLKPEQSIDNMSMDPARFRLPWRNVYDISAGDAANLQAFIKDFRLRIYHTQKDIAVPLENIKNVPITEILGLSKGSKILTDRTKIFDFENRDLIFPPYDTGSTGNEPFANPELKSENGEDLRDTMIYRFGPRSDQLASTSTYQPNFTMEMSGSKKQTSFSLGFGVMETTVQVKADGRQLTKNVDYVVNVEMGTIELISPQALAADKIDIEYQRDALFMPERKLFLGLRGEVQLPFISDKSFAGLSVLYQSTSISQDIPRIGQEPFSKLLLDFNTKVDLQPAWMTALVNKIPLIKTDAQSSASIELEVAHSRMNPNTEKEAFVDDFESSKQMYSLGESYQSWYMASPPYAPDSVVNYPPAWESYWFTPVYTDAANRIDREEIWVPDTGRVLTGMDKYETVLRLHVRPAPRDAALKDRFRKAWAGIMTPVPVSMADRKRDQYFELLLKCPGGGAGKGKLRVQMGRIREDLCLSGGRPNASPDREDTSSIWTENHSEELDRGLDTLTDRGEKYFIPDGNGKWDSLPYSDPRLEDFAGDPAKDNFRIYTYEHPENYRYACKYEKNGWATDNEDINSDGIVDVGSREQYHEFIIDLADTSSPYIDRTAAKVKSVNGWRRYRIPLHEMPIYKDTLRREIGGIKPSEWGNIRMVRLIWNGFDNAHLSMVENGKVKENELILNGMQFVGNQWEAVILDTAGGAAKIEVSSINTRESAEYEQEVNKTNLIRRQDDETGYKQQEGSLRLNFRNVSSREEAIVQRSFAYQPLDISSYDSLAFVLYGKDSTGRIFDNDEIRFVFRFGSDTSTYYEYSQRISRGWNSLACINLRKLSDLKLAWLTNHPNDSIDTTGAAGALRVKAPKGRQPNFANIVWMAVGVACSKKSFGTTRYSGELWVDELKIVGIKKFNGWASRLGLQTQWADFLTISGGLDYSGGDFRTMTDTKIAMGDSKLSGNFSVSTGIDKFMPKQWGVSMPVGGSISSSLVRPQLKPNTDMYLSDSITKKPDGFIEMAKDVINKAAGRSLIDSKVTAAEHFETQSFSQSFFANYSKSGQPPNPAVDLLLNRVSTQFQYNMTTNHTNRGQRPDMPVDSNYVNYDSVSTYRGGVKYDLSPRDPPSWTKWKPAGGARAPWMPGRLKDIELSMLPEKIDFTVADATYSSSVLRQFEPDRNVRQPKKELTISHGVQVDYSPINPLVGLSYSLSINRDFPDNLSIGGPGKAYDFLNEQFFQVHSADYSNQAWHDYYILERERSRSQTLAVKMNPTLFDWLSTGADYKADYTGTVTRWGNDESTDFMDAKVNSGMNFNTSLTVSSLLQSSSDSSGFGRFAAKVKKGCDYIGFNNVNFTYSASSELNNKYWRSDFLYSRQDGKRRIGAADFLAYQMGFKDRGFDDIVFGDMDDMGFGGMRYRAYYNDSNDYYKDDIRRVTRTCQASTSLSFTRPIDLQLSSISLRWNEAFTVYPDTAKFDTTWTFPDFSVGARSGILDKIKLINTHVQGMNLSSSFTYKQDKGKSSASAGEESRGIAIGMSPLVAFDGTLKKWPVRFNFQHTISREKRMQGEGDEKSTQTQRNGDNLDLNYEIQQTTGKLTAIKLFRWSIPVRGRTTVGMRLAREHSVTMTGGQRTADNSNLSATPNVSYVFTDNVTGTLEYTGSRVTNMGAVTVTNILALIADIRF